MDTFRSCGNPVTKLQTLAVLWTLFGVFKKCPYNCQRWQFYGHCLVTANLGSSMDTFRSFQKVSIQLPTVAVLWTLPCNCIPHKSHTNLMQISPKLHVNLKQISCTSHLNLRGISDKPQVNVLKNSSKSQIFQVYLRHISGKSQTYVMHIYSKYLAYLRHLGHISTLYHHISGIYKACVMHI